MWRMGGALTPAGTLMFLCVEIVGTQIECEAIKTMGTWERGIYGINWWGR